MKSTSNFQITADKLIEQFELKNHPFGCGFFKETDRNSNLVTLTKPNGETVVRNLSTCIMTIFKSGQINPLHRTNSTQIIHYYPQSNSSLLVHVIQPNGKLKTYSMPEQGVQLIISPLTWFAFEVANKNPEAFVLSGHTVTPGFDPADYKPASRKALSYQYPNLIDFICKFTFDDCANKNEDKNVSSIKEKEIVFEENHLKCKL